MNITANQRDSVSMLSQTLLECERKGVAGPSGPSGSVTGLHGVLRAPAHPMSAAPARAGGVMALLETLPSIAPATRGYASGVNTMWDEVISATSAARSAAMANMTAAATRKTTSKELAFLDDKKLSIEEKLYRYMALMVKKADQDLVDAMKEFEGKKAASSSSTSSATSKTINDQQSSGGGGIFGVFGDVVGGIGSVMGDLGHAVVGSAESLAKEFGGPLLAAGVTALGMPFLAPMALQIGGSLGAGLIDGAASLVGLDMPDGAVNGSSTWLLPMPDSEKQGAAATSSTSSGTSGEVDEKLEMLNLQRLVEKQNAMFAALSNVLKSIHDARMTAVQNIR
jgi:hypothetical protein